MVIKQLEDGRYTFWCVACDDLHVTEEGNALLGTIASPTLRHAVYDWDDKNVCHLQIQRGMLHFLPGCTHEYAERTVPMPEMPMWMDDGWDTPEESATPTPETEVEHDQFAELSDADLYVEPDAFDDEFSLEGPGATGTWDAKRGWLDEW